MVQFFSITCVCTKLYALILKTYLTLWPSLLIDTASHVWHVPLLCPGIKENVEQHFPNFPVRKTNNFVDKTNL